MKNSLGRQLRNEIKDLYRMAVGRARRAFNRPTLLRNLTIALTYRCNARCEMCDIWKQKPDSVPELDRGVLDRLLASPTLRDVVSLSLTGGEPFLRLDLAEIVEHCSRHLRECYISLATNGLAGELVLKQTREMVLRSDREIWVNVSVDSLDESYNAVRGVPGGQTKVLATLENLVALSREYHRLHIGVLYTLTQHNIEQALPVLELSNRLGVQFSMNFINPGEVYYRHDPQPTLAWYREHLLELLDLFNRLQEAGYQRPMATKLLRLFPDYLAHPQRPSVTCMAAFTSAFVTPEADVYPCVPTRKKFHLGNLHDQTFDQIWHSRRAAQVRRMIRSKQCNCLLTCETSNSLKFSPWFWLERAGKQILRK